MDVQAGHQEATHAESFVISSINSVFLKSASAGDDIDTAGQSKAAVSNDQQHLRPGAVIGAASVWSGVATDFTLVAATSCELLTLSAAHLALVLSAVSPSDAEAVGVEAMAFLTRSEPAAAADLASGQELVQSMLRRFSLDLALQSDGATESSSALEQLNCARTVQAEATSTGGINE
jgi:CRP-like cAMP-binding protein